MLFLVFGMLLVAAVCLRWPKAALAIELVMPTLCFAGAGYLLLGFRRPLVGMPLLLMVGLGLVLGERARRRVVLRRRAGHHSVKLDVFVVVYDGTHVFATWPRSRLPWLRSGCLDAVAVRHSSLHHLHPYRLSMRGSQPLMPRMPQQLVTRSSQLIAT